eukprot:4160819-Amphidinium_carterae.1
MQRERNWNERNSEEQQHAIVNAWILQKEDRSASFQTTVNKRNYSPPRDVRFKCKKEPNEKNTLAPHKPIHQYTHSQLI